MSRFLLTLLQIREICRIFAGSSPAGKMSSPGSEATLIHQGFAGFAGLRNSPEEQEPAFHIFHRVFNIL